MKAHALYKYGHIGVRCKILFYVCIAYDRKVCVIWGKTFRLISSGSVLSLHERHSGRYLLLQFYHLVTGIQADIFCYSSTTWWLAFRQISSVAVLPLGDWHSGRYSWCVLLFISSACKQDCCFSLGKFSKSVMTIKREIDAVVIFFYYYVGQETCLIKQNCACRMEVFGSCILCVVM